MSDRDHIPDFACYEKLDKHHIQIRVSGVVPGPRGWQPWNCVVWIPQVRLPRVKDHFNKVRKLKIKLTGA